MIFAKRVFQIAGLYGLIIIALGYGAYLYEGNEFLLNNPRAEYVHGFFLVTFAWQIAFLIIATDPLRYRMLMLAAMLEKLPFTLAILLLFARGNVGITMLTFGLIDGVLGLLFCIAYMLTERSAREEAEAA